VDLVVKNGSNQLIGFRREALLQLFNAALKGGTHVAPSRLWKRFGSVQRESAWAWQALQLVNLLLSALEW
jgi:hypothetical protein